MKRTDDYESRRQHLAGYDNTELNERFRELTEQVIEPLLALARRSTTPSIERSVLLRMGFSSIEAQAIVKGVTDRGLMRKGAGHVVYKLARHKPMSIRDAGVALAEGRHWDDVLALFAVKRS